MEKNESKNLKALLLVGGFGTRLRPLTFTKPKPLVEFINRPIMMHQIEALKSVGVNEIILAINYQPEKMLDLIKEMEEKYNVKITCSKEEEPLGTAGPIGLAKSILLNSDLDELFVFNSDITCRFPLKEMHEFHKQHGKEGTIAVTKVKDPSRFGVILTDHQNKILDFVEKPQEYVGNNINSGLYIFSKKFLDRVQPIPTSIEREVFPKMASDGELYAFDLEGFWQDIGQPKDYLSGTTLYLADQALKGNDSLLVKGKGYIRGNVIIVKINYLYRTPLQPLLKIV
jgi:mannose-1-phosphate guanylyltransferase